MGQNATLLLVMWCCSCCGRSRALDVGPPRTCRTCVIIIQPTKGCSVDNACPGRPRASPPSCFCCHARCTASPASSSVASIVRCDLYVRLNQGSSYPSYCKWPPPASLAGCARKQTLAAAVAAAALAKKSRRQPSVTSPGRK